MLSNPTRILALVACLAGASASLPAAGAVVCQKGNKVKLRAAACKANEVAVADLGGNVVGTWDHRDGNALSNGAFVPSFLALNADGSGRLIRREPVSQVLSCDSLRYAPGGPSLTVRVSFDLDVVQAAFEGSDVLRLTDDAGTSVFDRVASIGAGEDCGTLVETSRLSNVPPIFRGSVGLSFDGTSFVYLNDSFAPVLVDAASGVEGTPPDLGGGLGRIPYASEGGDFWGLCGCGRNDVAVRTGPTGTVVDETTSLLGEAKSLIALAVPTPGQLLMLASEGGNTFSGSLVLVDTASEPDVLLSQVGFNVNLHSMAQDGATLWGLQSIGTHANVVAIDPVTGLAAGTFAIPDTTVDWRALTAAGGQIFVAGNASNGQGVIATFAQPSL